MKKEFITPKVDIVKLLKTDIIASSGECGVSDVYCEGYTVSPGDM